ncbi:MAG: hypothetical protein EA397_09500 [Deltaproteobacteria bacterium]|nr:MAG: hypothetical protein EA397_09500 [Deltaproteobacteria bacterium]
MRGLPLISFFVWACAPAPETGDLFFVAVGSHDVEPQSVTAAIESYYFLACGDVSVTEVLVGYRLNLLQPEPMPVPVDLYCTLGVELARDPLTGSLRIAGQLNDGREFRVAMDPGLVTREREIPYQVHTKGILALDFDLLFEPADIAELQAMPEPIDLPTDDPLSVSLARRVGDALVFLDSPEVASQTYVEFWPPFDFSVSADIRVEGCGRNAPLVVVNPRSDPHDDPQDSDDTTVPSDSTPSDATPSDPTAGSDPDARPPRRQSDGCGCAGESGCGSGGCRGGCNPDCATLPLAPAGWAAFLGFLILRRRQP